MNIPGTNSAAEQEEVMNIQEMPRYPIEVGELQVGIVNTRRKKRAMPTEERWINGQTLNGFHAWVGNEHPDTSNWPKKNGPVKNWAQVFGVVNDRSEWSPQLALQEIVRRTGCTWRINREYELEKVDFKDDRFYMTVILERTHD